nr:MAG: hypothetical protein [Lokiarchaeota virus Skoll Meg22_1214]
MTAKLRGGGEGEERLGKEIIRKMNEISVHFYHLLVDLGNLEEEEQVRFLEVVEIYFQELLKSMRKMGDEWLSYLQKNEDGLRHEVFQREFRILERFLDIDIALREIFSVI